MSEVYLLQNCSISAVRDPSDQPNGELTQCRLFSDSELQNPYDGPNFVEEISEHHHVEWQRRENGNYYPQVYNPNPPTDH